jgi:hypothetical protein
MSTSSTNKLLVLNSIILVLILSLVILVNFSKLKKLVRNADDLYESSYDNYPDIRYFPKQDSLDVDLSGLENDTIPLPEEMIGIVSTELEAFNWNDEFQTEDLYNISHETVFAKQFSKGSKASKGFVVVIFSNHGGNHSHVARGRISLFEFQKQNNDWKLTRKYLAFGYGTESGMEPLWCKMVSIGKNKYALIVQTNYSGNGGHELETQSIYSEVGCSFENVFDFRNYEHYEDYPQDIEYTEGYSNMRFIKSNKSWFDIETKSEDTEWNDITLGAVKRYVFNGKEYVETIPQRHQKAF